MDYEEKLLRSIYNPEAYVGFEDSNSLSQIHGIAEDSYFSKTLEGYYAAAIIYHQLTQEILLFLIKYSDLLIQSKLYPEKINTYYSELNSFSSVINRFKICLVFQNKDKILKHSLELNDRRVKLVHNISNFRGRDEIERSAIEIHNLFEIIFKDWRQASGWFYDKFNMIKSDKKWALRFKKYRIHLQVK